MGRKRANNGLSTPEEIKLVARKTSTNVMSRMKKSFMLLFLSVVLQGWLSGAFSESKYKAEKSNQKDFLDIAVFISGVVAKVGMAVGFVSLMISGGGPEIVDGVYCVVSHGDILYDISRNLYVYLSVCEYMLMFCGLLVFTTYMFNRIRNLYRLQNQAPNIKD